MSSGLDLMYALVLESGKRWGEIAADFQKQDACAIFSAERPNLHFLTRPRGGSKTTDLAGISLSWLAAEAPPRARGVVVASNADQAALLIDAAAGFVARTPELNNYLVVENERILSPNGASVRVLPASDSGSWGLLNVHLLVADELCQWPETRGARRIWSAIRSTVQKTPGLRFIVLTSAGEPSHWSYSEVFKKALADPATWRVHEVPGPVPWQDPADIAALQRELLPSEFDRLVLNRWSEAEDRAISPEDFDAAAVKAVRHGIAPAGLKGGGYRLHHPREGEKYLITGDIGLKNDATALAVCHREALTEDRHGPHRLIVDHLERWQGGRRHHVQLVDVEKWLLTTSQEYNGAAVHLDPDQAMGTLQNLGRQGVRAQEFAFTLTSVGQVATALMQTFRSGLVEVPETPELRAELLTVKLRDSGHGVVRLDHDASGHDDQAVVIGMAAHLLLGRTGWGPAAAFVAAMKSAVNKRQQVGPTVDGSPAERRAMRELRRHQATRGGGQRRGDQMRQRQQLACEHRWRLGPDGVLRCVWGCGAVREEGA